MSKVQPAQRTLSFLVPPGESYIDLAEALSSVNRRFYRQGMQYAVTGIDFRFNGKPGSADFISVFAKTAGSTWVVHNAWKKAQATWIAQQRDSRKAAGAFIKPAYEDFKVYLDDAHRTGTSLPVVASDAAVVMAGEWNYSKFVYSTDADAAVLEPHLHLIGGDVSTSDVGIVEAYEESRSTVQSPDPNAPATASHSIYSLMSTNVNEVADEVIQNQETENDQTPYDLDEYPGGETNSDVPWVQSIATAAAGIPGATLPGFVAQCGLIRLTSQGYATNGDETAAPPLLVLVHLAPGPYKGVLAEPMGQ